ncbi:HEPN domain-containing protein [bacterium]|nr:HEPN domain-containing protein [bacterium]MBU1753740.1 HEPN domain-containing protein [bacterium]
MAKKYEEWLKQADYDINTAEYMFDGGRYFYAVFMCHLSIEKALKGLYLERLKEMSPKVHNLIYLLNKSGVKPPETIGRFLVTLNEASVVTRYPDNIEKLQRDYTKDVVMDIVSKSKEVLRWIKTQF